MIDPFKITDFKRPTNLLEEFLIFGFFVAGKKAVQIAPKVDEFISSMYPYGSQGATPFEYILELDIDGHLEEELRAAKLGKYSFAMRGLPDLVRRNWDLTTVTRNELEDIYGIGPKTSRFFLLHSRPGQRYVVFDTHISKWAYDRGLVPFDDTPDKKVYDLYEPIVLDYLERVEGITDFADFDLSKWKEGTKTRPLSEVISGKHVAKKASSQPKTRISKKNSTSGARKSVRNSYSA